MNNKKEKALEQLTTSHPNYMAIRKALMDNPSPDDDITFISDTGLQDNYQNPYEQILNPHDVLIDLHEHETLEMTTESQEFEEYQSPAFDYEQVLDQDDVMVDDAFEVTANDRLKTSITDLLSEQSEREQKVIASRFGLNDTQELTLEETGRAMDISGQRVRQIEAKALRKLRHPMKSDVIRDHMYPDHQFETAYVRKQELKEASDEASLQFAAREMKLRRDDHLQENLKSDLHDIHLAIDKAERTDCVLYARDLKMLLKEKMAEGKRRVPNYSSINEEAMDSSRKISEALSYHQLITELKSTIEFESNVFGHVDSNEGIVQKIEELHLDKILAIRYSCPKLAKSIQNEITKIESGFKAQYFEELQDEIESNASQSVKNMSFADFKEKSVAIMEAEKAIEAKITEGNNKREAERLGLSTHEFMTEDKNAQMSAMMGIMHKVQSESENSF